MEAPRAAVETPLRPAIDVRPPLVVTRASSATLCESSVAPAPVSIAKSYGPTELIHVLTMRPRPGTSRNETGVGTLRAAGGCCRLPLLLETERAAPNETALPSVVRLRNNANRSLALPLMPQDPGSSPN